MSFNNIKSYGISSLESLIGHKFSNVDLLNEALSHSSFINENTKSYKDNERLEFLGDAVLNFIVSDIIVKYYPELHEGDLSRMRANLVNEIQLSNIAKSIKLGSYLYLGKGEEQTNGRHKNSILANALEAIIAAVYLDGGIRPSFTLVKKLFQNIIATTNTVKVDIDYKSNLQEKVQVLYHKVPKYLVVSELGPDHDKLFRVRMVVCNIVSYGEGTTKKAAEQLAARKGLLLLNKYDLKFLHLTKQKN